jgi:hypothetical protein
MSAKKVGEVVLAALVVVIVVAGTVLYYAWRPIRNILFHSYADGWFYQLLGTIDLGSVIEVTWNGAPIAIPTWVPTLAAIVTIAVAIGPLGFHQYVRLTTPSTAKKRPRIREAFSLCQKFSDRKSAPTSSVSGRDGWLPCDRACTRARG